MMTTAAAVIRGRVLRAAGFAVIEAAGGADALALAAAEHPALVVLDVRLPDLDGLEVCRRFKSDARTGNAGEPEHGLPEALEHEPDDYLREPVEPDILVATVRALIRASQYRVETEVFMHDDVA